MVARMQLRRADGTLGRLRCVQRHDSYDAPARAHARKKALTPHASAWRSRKVGVPALLRLVLDRANLLTQLLGLRKLLGLLPPIVWAARHVVRDHVLRLTDRAALLLGECGRQVELGCGLACGSQTPNVERLWRGDMGQLRVYDVRAAHAHMHTCTRARARWTVGKVCRARARATHAEPRARRVARPQEGASGMGLRRVSRSPDCEEWARTVSLAHLARLVARLCRGCRSPRSEDVCCGLTYADRRNSPPVLTLRERASCGMSPHLAFSLGSLGSALLPPCSCFPVLWSRGQ